MSQNNITCYCHAAGVGLYTNLYGLVGFYGYNYETDRCEYCAGGCAQCFIDVDRCISCKAGYEYHPDSYTCVRAELGLAAAILAVSIILLGLSIAGCLKAKKE